MDIMKMKKDKREGYVSPELEVIDLHLESVLCASEPQPQLWYKQGGQGDFDYDVEEEISWK